MNLFGLAQKLEQVKFLAMENSPTILTGLGVAGTVTTAYLTGRATVKAVRLIDQKEEQANLANQTDDIPFSNTTKVRIVWKLYIPPVGAGATTVASIIMANKISSKRLAALAVASSISERALQEYKEKVLQKWGDKQERNVRDEIAQDRVTNNPVNPREVLVTGNGTVLCYDMHTGRYFESSVEDIKRAENKINYELIHSMSASASEFYDEIGLPPTTYTDQVGWNTNNHLEILFSTTMSPDQRPCIAIDFAKPPIREYHRNWD
jgi:hypothetical protein